MAIQRRLDLRTQSFEIRNEKERKMTTETNGAGWTTAAVLVGRLIFAALFIMAVGFKPIGTIATAAPNAAAGVPPPPLFACGPAGRESALPQCLLSGSPVFLCISACTYC